MTLFVLWDIIRDFLSALFLPHVDGHDIFINDFLGPF